MSPQDVLGEVLQGENYSVCWPACIRHDSMKITGCLDADKFMKGTHYYFSNYIGFLEMYLTVCLEWAVFTFSSSGNKPFLLTWTVFFIDIERQTQHLKITSKKKNVGLSSDDESWNRLFKRRLLCLGCKNISLNLF